MRISKKAVFIDPQIPGIKMVPSHSAEFGKIPGSIKVTSEHGFAIRNDSRQRIVELATEYVAGGRHMIAEADGINSPFAGLAPGDTALAYPGHLEANGYVIDSPDWGERYIQQGIETASLYFVIFEDGTFYGSEEEGQRLRDKIKYRNEFFADMKKASDLPEYIVSATKCGMDAECVKSSPISPASWNERNMVLQTFGAAAAFKSGQEEMILQNFLEIMKNYPGVKRIVPLPSDKDSLARGIQPKDPTDGWGIYKLYGGCLYGDTDQLTNPFYKFSLVHNCTYPTAGLGSGPPLSFTKRGHVWNFGAACLNFKGPANALSSQNFLWDYGNFAQLLPSDVDNKYLPREMVFTSLFSNYASFPQDFPDVVVSAQVAGIIEPFAVDADADGGETICSVAWYEKGSDLPNKFDLLSLFNTMGGGSVYGYVIQNYQRTQSCNGIDREARFTMAVPAKNGSGSSQVNCEHNSQAVASGGSQGCDPHLDFCCCMAAYSNLYQCIGYGLPQQDYCSIAGNAASYVENVEGKVAPDARIGVGGTFKTSPDKIGIVRNGTSFLLDQPDREVYVAGETLEYTFTPPGGLQASDVAVSGDWAGLGQTCVGFYRGATGHWYLDWNCNGAWDGATIDRDYTFGGLQPVGNPPTGNQLGNWGATNYTPGDVPVVGNWNGVGSHGPMSCIGVFRQGFAWLLDTNCNGTWDSGSDNYFTFGGIPGDMPVVGHWIAPPPGNPVFDQVGVVRCYIAPFSSPPVCQSYPFLWVLDGAYANYPLQAGHTPGSGGTNCLSYDTHCLTPAPFAFGGLGPPGGGAPGDAYLTGDWLGNGISRAGLYRYGFWIEDQDGTHQGNTFIGFGGLPNDRPLVGRW